MRKNETPLTDAVDLSIGGGSYPDGSDGVTAEEDATSKLLARARSLERDRAELLALLRDWHATGIVLRDHLPDNEIMELTAALLARMPA